MKKKLLVGFLGFMLFILVGCSSSALNGTWNYEGNSENTTLTLVINGENATVSINGSEGVGLAGTDISISGKILIGEMDTENKVITVTQDSDVKIESLGQSYSADSLGFEFSVGDTVPYTLSDDKKSIVLDLNLDSLGSVKFVKN